MEAIRGRRVNHPMHAAGWVGAPDRWVGGTHSDLAAIRVLALASGAPRLDPKRPEVRIDAGAWRVT